MIALETPLDQEAWLALRRSGVTATEMAGLFLSRFSGRAIMRLRMEKESPSPSFSTRAFEWGKARESVIHDYVVRKVDSRLVHNIDNAVARYRNDPRLMATPDAYSHDGELIGEYKTTSKPFTGGHFHEVVPDRYYLQVQTQLLCTGAERCVFAWEQHRDFDENATVLDSLILKPDPDVQMRLLLGVDRFFNYVPEPNQNLSEIIERCVELQQQAAVIKQQIQEHKEQITKLMGTNSSFDAGSAVATMKDGFVRKSVDTARLRKEMPEVFERYLKETHIAPSLQIKKVEQS